MEIDPKKKYKLNKVGIKEYIRFIGQDNELVNMIGRNHVYVKISKGREGFFYDKDNKIMNPYKPFYIPSKWTEEYIEPELYNMDSIYSNLEKLEKKVNNN